MNVNSMGNYFEDFIVGEELQHTLSKTIFESDNNLFSLITMNAHPVHTNADYAGKQQHGKILVVGTLVFSLVVGLTVMDISGKAIANLDYENIKHLAPTFIGDTLYGHASDLINRQALHSNKITFTHPITKQKIQLNAPFFQDMNQIIKTVE